MQYQSNLASQMSGRVGGLTTALNRVKLENDRLKGDRLTKEDVYIIMNTQGVSRIEIPKIPKGLGKLTAFQSLFMGGRFALL